MWNTQFWKRRNNRVEVARFISVWSKVIEPTANTEKESLQAIVLAAGNGKRFQPPLNVPKCLLQFGGKTILKRHIENLIRLGVERITIVTGYQSELVAQEVKTLDTGIAVCLRYNEDFEQGSVRSLSLVGDVLGQGESLITNGDLLYDFQILEQTARSPHANVLVIDSTFSDTGEEFYVWGENGLVTGFDHIVEGAHIVGEGVGISKCSAEVGALWASAAEKLAVTEPYAEYQSALESLFAQVRIPFLDIHGFAWTDVDDWNDLEYAGCEIYPALVSSGQA